MQWCERTLGVTPGPGGQHPLMGTHSRLLSLVSPYFPTAHFEISAIDLEAYQAMKTRASRWFHLDSADLQQSLASHGPRLIHAVVNTLSGISLQSLRASHPQAALLGWAHRAIGWAQLAIPEGQPTWPPPCTPRVVGSRSNHKAFEC